MIRIKLIAKSESLANLRRYFRNKLRITNSPIFVLIIATQESNQFPFCGEFTLFLECFTELIDSNIPIAISIQSHEHLMAIKRPVPLQLLPHLLTLILHIQLHFQHFP